MEPSTVIGLVISIFAVFVIPGLIAWISLRERIVRLEERVRMHETNHHESRQILEQIREELKEIRDKLPR